MQAKKKAIKQTSKLQDFLQLRDPEASKQTARMLASKEARREGSKEQEDK